MKPYIHAVNNVRKYGGKTDFEVQLELDVNLLESLIQGLHDMMKDIFDDHVIVTANRGGFDVEEYQHD